MERFLSLRTNQLNLNQYHYYSTTAEQFGQNHDYFELQKKFVDTYINQDFQIICRFNFSKKKYNE